MNENKKQKIMKTVLSLMISFLIIFIAAMFARAASNTILPENNSIAIFINDYLDMMMQKMDKIAVKMKIKRNSVSEYQVNLITQSISDYVGYNMYQAADSLKDFDPNNIPVKKELEKYKNSYYKMTVENPYLRGMTIFNINGKMLFNLYLSRNKSWPLELHDNLINEIKNKGSLVLNATNENAFYIMEYIKNSHGEIIAATRNDYAYVSDIAMYYQVADKRLYVSDARNSVYNVRDAVGDNNIEKVSSLINKYAYYKKQPSFMVNDSLSVSMIGKEYPNYFELIVLALTALLILACQLLIKALVNFFKYLMQIKRNRNYVESVRGSDELISKSIVNTKLPKSNIIEDMPPIIQKVHYKVPDEYLKENNTSKKDDNKFNIGNDILNIVSSIKEEINMCKNRFSISKEDIAEDSKEYSENAENTDSISENITTVEESITAAKDTKNDESVLIENNDSISINENNNNEIIDYDIENAFASIKRDLHEEYERAIEETFDIGDIEDIYSNNEIYNSDENTNSSDNALILSDNIEDDAENMKDDNIKEFMSISDEQLNNISVNNTFKTVNENDLKINNEFNRKIVKNDLLSASKNNNEKDNNLLFEIKKETDYINNDSHNISADILNSYNKALDNIRMKKENDSEKTEIKTSDNSRADDVFAAFDKMLSSIINKAEEDARKSITKK
ncbi:hypothetical protein [uncultured Brachyspira sp.]|uniref:hypothetical protein n=1 Tax=uncultured Brachyspira sp. TaxID=221953 RepID=UPI0025F05BB7|nr:hypothetical protein [uncultured Brachyspira sp.]